MNDFVYEDEGSLQTTQGREFMKTPNVENKKRIKGPMPQSQQNLEDNWTESYQHTGSETNTIVTSMKKIATGNIIVTEEEKN